MCLSLLFHALSLRLLARCCRCCCAHRLAASAQYCYRRCPHGFCMRCCRCERLVLPSSLLSPLPLRSLPQRLPASIAARGERLVLLSLPRLPPPPRSLSLRPAASVAAAAIAWSHHHDCDCRFCCRRRRQARRLHASHLLASRFRYRHRKVLGVSAATLAASATATASAWCCSRCACRLRTSRRERLMLPVAASPAIFAAAAASARCCRRFRARCRVCLRSGRVRLFENSMTIISRGGGGAEGGRKRAKESGAC